MEKNLYFVKMGCDYDEKATDMIGSWDENESHIKIDYNELDAYNYTKKDILNYIYKKFRVKFDNLILLDLSFCNYDYRKITGDKFQPDNEAIEQAKKIYSYFYDFEKNIENKKYPNFSMYYENDKLTILKHYNGFNDKIIINNIFDFDFNYKIPNKKGVIKNEIK